MCSLQRDSKRKETYICALYSEWGPKAFKWQKEYKTKKDWGTTVQQDFQLLGRSNLSMNEDKNNEENSVGELGKKDNKHENIWNSGKQKDVSFKSRTYLQPNNIKMKKEDAQLIFNVMCRMTQSKSKRGNMIY
jgi:hypothetical protein